jgi:hypothetical protein
MAQASVFGEASCFIANHGRDSDHISLRPAQETDRKCNRQRSAVLMHGGNSQQVMSVTRLPGRHGFSVTSPMALPQTLGNNEIERIAERLRRRESEQVLGSGVSYGDCTARIGDYNCVADHLDQLLKIDGCSHGTIHHLLARTGVGWWS